MEPVETNRVQQVEKRKQLEENIQKIEVENKVLQNLNKATLEKIQMINAENDREREEDKEVYDRVKLLYSQQLDQKIKQEQEVKQQVQDILDLINAEKGCIEIFQKKVLDHQKINDAESKD